MSIVSGAATGVGRTSILTVPAPGDQVHVELSGTYNMVIQLEKEVGSPGSGSYEVVLGPWSTANATVAEVYTTNDHNERLVLNVTTDTSGTVNYAIFDDDESIRQITDPVTGAVVRTEYENKMVFENDVEVKGNLFNHRNHWHFFDDFGYTTFVAADRGWTDLSGTDAQAVKAFTAAEGGVAIITSGNADGTFAADGEQLTLSIPVQADSGGLVAECRLHMNSAVTGGSMGFALTDVTTLEEPVSIATTTITTNASNAVGFFYDTAATTDQWYCVGVDGDTDAVNSGLSGTAPVADTYQILRMEIAADGESAKFFIDGEHVHTLYGTVCAASTNLFMTVYVCSTTTTSVSIDVDYVYLGTNR